MVKQLKISADAVNDIVCWIFTSDLKDFAETKCPRAVVEKFGHFTQKQLVQSACDLNDEFPLEIFNRRKVLFQIKKQNMQEGKKRQMLRSTYFTLMVRCSVTRASLLF